ncbi:hypothetical protein EDEG_00891 [Edhazardia aedis USNM 41457]|uniref:RGS domain-containing protein n=1 Tax=Edhazardia aedis (strain USNM 41457) TaxID=1003232 RepID=J9DB78_EDHAE|nr:hypothetical protein EDEG_00891 [Edhazardia aedis USNM 41457]|eukprot:EJW05011.1 hypothetical protein EDEG_00891 [Edhazardia aedis USNM 41457]
MILCLMLFIFVKKFAKNKNFDDVDTFIAYTFCNFPKEKDYDRMLFEIFEEYVMNFLSEKKINSNNCEYKKTPVQTDLKYFDEIKTVLYKEIAEYICLVFEKENIESLYLNVDSNAIKCINEDKISDFISSSKISNYQNWEAALKVFTYFFTRDNEFKNTFFIKLKVEMLDLRKTNINWINVVNHYISGFRIRFRTYSNALLHIFRNRYSKFNKTIATIDIKNDIFQDPKELLHILNNMKSSLKKNFSKKISIHFRLCKEQFVYNWLSKNLTTNKTLEIHEKLEKHFFSLLNRKLQFFKNIYKKETKDFCATLNTTLKNIDISNFEKKPIKSQKKNLFGQESEINTDLKGLKNYLYQNEAILLKESKMVSSDSSCVVNKQTKKNSNVDANIKTKIFKNSIQYAITVSLHNEYVLKHNHFDISDLNRLNNKYMPTDNQLRNKIVEFCESEKSLIYNVLIMRFFQALIEFAPNKYYMLYLNQDNMGFRILVNKK